MKLFNKDIPHINVKLPDLINKYGVLDALSSVTAIIVGLLAGLIILFISNASQALYGFEAIITSGFSNLNDLGQVLYFATPIILTGLSVGFSAKTGLFNIGAAGQFMVGAYAAVLVGVKCGFLPGHLLWITALLAALIAGALWGAIPGIFKALFNVNEVISCIMTNYIGTYLVNYLVTKTVFDSLRNQSMRVMEHANIPKLGMDKIFRDGFIVSSVNAGIIIAVIFAVIIFIILEKTAFGYELKACGFNREAARYAGINEKRSIILSMTIAGALAGLGGALLFLAGSGNGIRVVDILAQEGFNGIPVALLGLNNPIGIIFSGMLVAYLNVGGFKMQLYNFAPQVIEIIIAVIIYFSAFALLVRDFIASIIKRKRGEL
ncbi:MAG: ABC transporter permease [Treponema sp.]|nr:ABC transporter permease [Treponema sp.]MCL2250593.1 ABC transporter permease [Treponema sp.]